LQVLIFNPVVVAVLLGCFVSVVSPLQRVLFFSVPVLAQVCCKEIQTTFVLFCSSSKVSETLGSCNVGAHLLLLGLQLLPFERPVAWPLVFLASAVRLVLVPAVFFLAVLALLPPGRDAALLWTPLALSGTPANLGLLVVAAKLHDPAIAPQLLVFSYAGAILTVPLFNVLILMRIL
jgi:predicted permease